MSESSVSGTSSGTESSVSGTSSGTASSVSGTSSGTESSVSGTSSGTESSVSGTSSGTASSASGASDGTESSASGTSTTLHIKGYILRLLAEREAQQTGLWDDELCNAVCTEYGVDGDYWRGTVRLTLTDLFSGGLLDELETTVDPERSGGVERVLFKFRLNDFGRERMRQSGLLEVAAP